MEVKIGERRISKEDKPYFIADIAANHDGDLNRAYELIKLAKEAGADAAKFQNFKADMIVSRRGFESLQAQLSHQATWKKSVYDTYEDASISDEWTQKLKEKCEEVDIEYMTSPYDIASVDWADKYVNAYKIGSGDITWDFILDYIAQKGKPILLATGASNLLEVKHAMEILQKHNSKIVLMQCNTNYTASQENYSFINLNVLKTFGEIYPNCILGLSDHTLGHTTVLGALALGARVFEKHFTDDNYRVGPDHRFSMNPKSWKEMIDASSDLYEALGDGVKRVEKNEVDTVNIQRRAVYAIKNIAKGEKITEDMIFPLRPVFGNAILPSQMEKILETYAKKDILADSCLLWEDIENV